jgi:hypothetical protein
MKTMSATEFKKNFSALLKQMTVPKKSFCVRTIERFDNFLIRPIRTNS